MKRTNRRTHVSKNRQHQNRSRKLILEQLESRQLLATFHVALTGNDANMGGTGDPYRTVQAAINAAAAASDGGDVINVATGTYSTFGVDGQLSIPSSVNLSSLQLLGGWDSSFTTRNPVVTPTVYTFTTAPAFRYDINVTDSNTTIDGFTFNSSDGITPREADTVLVDAIGVTINNIVINAGIRNGGSRPVGIVTTLNDTSGLQISNNTINVDYTGVAASSTAGIGIFFNPSTQAGTITVSGNTISGNNMNSGVIVSGVSNVTIQSNTINRSTPLFGAGIELRNNTAASSNHSILDNTINDTSLAPANSGIGVQLGGSSGLSLTNITLRGNLVTMAGPSTTGLFAGTGSAAASILNERNSFVSARAGGAVTSGIAGLDVSGNWLGANTALGVSANIDGRIQSGIDRAASGMTVRVAADTYAENVTIDKSQSLLGDSRRPAYRSIPLARPADRSASS